MTRGKAYCKSYIFRILWTYEQTIIYKIFMHFYWVLYQIPTEVYRGFFVILLLNMAFKYLGIYMQCVSNNNYNKYSITTRYVRSTFLLLKQVYYLVCAKILHFKYCYFNKLSDDVAARCNAMQLQNWLNWLNLKILELFQCQRQVRLDSWDLQR